MTTREIVTAYLGAIEAHDVEQVARYLHPDVVTVEHPNKLQLAGKRYDRDAMRAAGERGKAVMASERYEIRQMTVEGDRAAVQIAWTGTLAVAAGPLPAGHTMHAEICSVIERLGPARRVTAVEWGRVAVIALFEIRDGLVWRQEQYDCFV